MERYTNIWTRKRLPVAVVLLLATAGCGTTKPQQGLAESDAKQSSTITTALATTGASTDPEANDNGATETGGTAAQGDAGDSTGSLADGLILDLNYEVPETLTAGLVHAEIRNLIVDIHGPTDDIAAEINRLSVFPANFPTMPGSDIYELVLSSNVNSSRPHYEAQIRFTLQAPVEEVIAFYESNLTAPSFVVAETSDRTEDSLTIHTASYTTPTSDDIFNQGLVISFITGDFDGTTVFVDSKDALSPAEEARAIDQMSVLIGWHPAPAPIPPDGQLQRVYTASSFDANFGGSKATFIVHDFIYPNAAGEGLAQSAYDLIVGSDYDFSDSSGQPPSEEIIPSALAAGKNSIFFPLTHPALMNNARLTVDFYENSDPSVDFETRVDLLEAP